jgi:hypothetical protein
MRSGWVWCGKEEVRNTNPKNKEKVMAMVEATYRIVGISPLLLHNPAGSMEAGGKKGVGTKKIPTPEDEAEAGTYRTESGQLYLKSISFRSALLEACKGRRIGKIGAKAVLGGSVFNTDEICPLVDPKTGKPVKTYRINAMRAVIQKKNAVIRHRPQIDAWATEVRFEIDGDLVSTEVVTELLGMAGRMAGVGDYRPQRGGPYGRFTAELVKEKSLAA